MVGFSFVIIAFCILGYLVGNVLFAQVLAQFYKKNLRKEGSFNPGATNLVRTTKNRWIGICASLLDAAKCYLIVLACGYATYNNLHLHTFGKYSQNWAVYIPGLFVIFGHCFPLMYFITFFKKNAEAAKEFTGGKGVSSFGGLVIAFSPYVALCGIAIWTLVLVISKYVSLASVITVLACCGLMWVPQLQLFYFTHMPFSSLWGVFMIMLIGAIYIVCRHKPNLIKIHNKTESKAFSKNK